ncbi:Zn-ribbon domain-containing OB-fold protein [Bradyrhizobium sp. KBS0727]|uniref:Zn-ribbon domain-containing OB-fold protein n=1 Tax=unclassified Bradyrhizobium TaxID=2631580 RepID=UPI00110D49A8|nr:MULTISPECIES: Zn-ribbon domain-containing OB-fold protein [unclassified Bradyrhizobium]QDW39893.1 Zn-ribbon domain-containing OB-fold protein [Bradyrhizobium sp. KBS0725]QDW46496.1 Zn-ribbon domain-containing OB-fold protein [Bradyrhizobium sp. KBS0727]
MSIEFDPLAGQRPAPIPLNFSKPFWDGAKDKKLMLQYCPQSGKYQFYPRPISVYNGSRKLEWRESSGRGKIYSFSLSYKAPPPFKDVKPYLIASVELEEGVRILTNIINCDPKSVKIDMPVRVVWVQAGTTNYPVFEPTA